MTNLTNEITTAAEILNTITRAVMAGCTNDEIIDGLERSLNIEIPAVSQTWIGERANEVRVIFS
jgi:hypothetical protein